MTSIFFEVVRICHNQFKCNCLKTKKCFLNFLLHFWNLHQILIILKKWRLSEVVHFRNYRLPNIWLDQCLKSPVTEHPSKIILLKVSKHLQNLHGSSSTIFFMTLGKLELENVCVSNMWNLQTVFNILTPDDKYFLCNT